MRSLWKYEDLVLFDMHNVNCRCVAACCSVLQRVAVRRSVLQCVAVSCSVLQCVAVCCSVLQCVAVLDIARAHTVCSLREYEYRVSQVDMHYVNVCCSASQSVAECFSVLQCVAVCCSV